jgi:hypothetical protein
LFILQHFVILNRTNKHMTSEQVKDLKARVEALRRYL